MKYKKLFTLLFIFFFLPGFFLLEAAPSLESSVATYDQLVSSIRQVRAASTERLELAANQEKVREAWETGKLIDEHVFQHKERADYDKQIILRLAKDLDTSETELRYMLQFFRAYPIHRTSGELTWGHYESLLALNESREREEVEKIASREKWTVKQVREEVRRRKESKNEKEEPEKEIKLTAAPGKPGICKIVKATVGPLAGKLVLSLGFSNYYDYQPFLTTADTFQEGDIVEVASDGKTLEKISTASFNDLYTYRAYIAEVIDGDTFKAVIDLGFGIWTAQKLRLRGLDAPEMISSEGKAARHFVEDTLSHQDAKKQRSQDEKEEVKSLPLSDFASLPPVLIRTSRSDKYDRYLADVFIGDLYLNNALLEKGHAVRMDD